jgi:hypothetical protein
MAGPEQLALEIVEAVTESADFVRQSPKMSNKCWSTAAGDVRLVTCVVVGDQKASASIRKLFDASVEAAELLPLVC